MVLVSWEHISLQSWFISYSPWLRKRVIALGEKVRGSQDWRESISCHKLLPRTSICALLMRLILWFLGRNVVIILTSTHDSLELQTLEEPPQWLWFGSNLASAEGSHGRERIEEGNQVSHLCLQQSQALTKLSNPQEPCFPASVPGCGTPTTTPLLPS